jgi:hypothetical protein
LKTKTIKSLKWLLVEAAEKLIDYGRRIILKVATDIDKYKIYLEMERRAYKLLVE